MKSGTTDRIHLACSATFNTYCLHFSAEVLMLLLAELLILMKIGLEGLSGMGPDASEGEAVLAVTLRRKDGGDRQRDQYTDTGIDDTGDRVRHDAFLADREHHDEIHDGTRLNR